MNQHNIGNVLVYHKNHCKISVFECESPAGQNTEQFTNCAHFSKNSNFSKLSRTEKCRLDDRARVQKFFVECRASSSRRMFKNTFQSGFLSILYSIGSKPLQIWDKKVRNGHIKRITDNDIQVKNKFFRKGIEIKAFF